MSNAEEHGFCPKGFLLGIALKFLVFSLAAKLRRSGSSVVEHSSTDPKGPGSSLGPGMDYDETCFMHLTPRVIHIFPKAVDVYTFS